MRIGIVGILALLVWSPSVSAQSLGEIAKKASEAKAAKEKDGTTKPPGKPITDKDLKADPTAPKTAASSDAKAVPDASPSAKPLDGVEQSKKDEAYWRGRLLPLLEKLRSDRKASDAVAANLADTRARMQATLASLAVFGSEVVRLSNELNTLNTIVAEDLAAIEALKEEGRRAGAFPGWFR
jgi:hypothetical protein